MSPKLFETYVRGSVVTPGLVARLTRPAPVTYPVFTMAPPHVQAGTAFIGWVHELLHEDRGHTVVVCYSEGLEGPQLQVWCRDKFIEGLLPRQDALERCSLMCEVEDLDQSVANAAMSLHRAHNESQPCTFWANLRLHGILCSHTQTFLAFLKEKHPSFESELAVRHRKLSRRSAPGDL